MALNYRKNSITCTTENYPNISDLNGLGVCGGNRINIRTGGSTQYIGLVAPGHIQASDLSVRVGNNDLRLAKKSKFTTCTFGWGLNNVTFGASILGDGTQTSRCVPYLICGQLFKSISMGSGHTLGLKEDGTLWAWGSNTSGELGIGTASPTGTLVPVPVCGGHLFCAATAAGGRSYGLKSDGTLWAWGNSNGAGLGNGTSGTGSNACLPVPVCGGHLFCAVSAAAHVIALKADGTAWGWGCNFAGGIGNNTIVDACCPVPVCGGHLFCAVSVGNSGWTLAIRCDCRLYAWGENLNGQLGDGTQVCKITPNPVTNGCDFCAISAGFRTSVALKTNGTAWAWGNNTSGQLGLGTSGSPTNVFVPNAVCGGHFFCDITTFAHHTLALKADGTAWAWGLNTSGQLGDGTVTGRCVPVAVCGGNIFCAIVNSGGFSCSSFAISCHWLSP